MLLPPMGYCDRYECMADHAGRCVVVAPMGLVCTLRLAGLARPPVMYRPESDIQQALILLK